MRRRLLRGLLPLALGFVVSCSSTPPPDVSHRGDAPSAQVASASSAPPAPPTSNPPTEEERAHAGELVKLLREVASLKGHETPEDLKRTIAKLRALATPRELPMFDRLDTMLADVTEVSTILDGKGSLEEKRLRFEPILDRVLHTNVQILRDIAALSPDDPDSQLTLAQGLYSMPDQAAGFGDKDPARDSAWRHEGETIADALFKKFPSMPHVAELRGWMCIRDGGESSECIRYYAGCKKQASPESTCAKTYRGLAEDMTSVRCSDGAIRPSLRVFTGTYMGGASPTVAITPPPDALPAIAPGPGPMQVDKQPGFVLRDIVDHARATVSQSTHKDWNNATSTWGPPTTTDVRMVLLTVKPDRRADFDAWLAKTVEPHISTWLVVLEGNRWVGAALLEPSNPQLALANVAIDALCTKTEKPAFPSDLPPP